ncbi:MAG TPA: DUF4389 domain-containing protein [Kofleriaceae bacterium]
MTHDHPVQLEVRSPAHFDRVQLVLRLVLVILLAWVGLSTGWLGIAFYLLLPAAAAIAVSSEGRDVYRQDFAPQLWRVLRWVFELSAYMMLLTDRFPTADGELVHADIRITGQPTIGSALGRLVTSIPSALVLGVLGIGSTILTVIAVIVVLAAAPMPGWILAYQRGVLRWQARLAAYHASLVDEYPPFALETVGTEVGSARALREASPRSEGTARSGRPHGAA